MITILFVFLPIFALTFAITAEERAKLLEPGNCKGLWRPDSLPGKCFGLHVHTNRKGFWDLLINSAEECRSLCCNLEDQCVSWQKECKIGGPVRLGLEQSGTVDWCDPFLPSPWNGNKILSRQNGKCYWGDRVVNQCFGLGAEQMNSDGSSKNAAECEKACCESPECEIWQQQDGRGCYYNKNDGINCLADPVPYEGARKCIHEYCGTPEEEEAILSRYRAMKQS